MYAYAIPRFCRECLVINLAGWYAHVARVYLLGFGTYGLAWLVAAVWGRGSYPAILMLVAFIAASIAYLPVAYTLLDSELKNTLRRLPGLLLTRNARSIQR